MSIAGNLQRVRERLAEAERAAGRAQGTVRLVAVSKTWPASAVAEAAAAGQRDFGENRVQELEEKVPEGDSSWQWHLIGPLQKNKVRKALPLCTMIHSIDSLSLAERVDRIAGELGLRSRILLQVNVGEEDSKSGFSSGSARAALTGVLGLPHLEVVGLMTVPPFDPDPERVRPFFVELRELRDRLEVDAGCSLPELSMGMSHDFEVAVAEGATIVRVGSSIFGERG